MKHEDDKAILSNFLDELKNDLELFEKKQKTLDKKRGGPKKKGVRALSGYNRFVKMEMTNIRSKYPELAQTQHMSKAAELWNALSDEEKQKYKVERVDTVENA
jgi:hypothetical protein